LESQSEKYGSQEVASKLEKGPLRDHETDFWFTSSTNGSGEEDF
jgi:hypothetical protein